jgi:hypothetical protein
MGMNDSYVFSCFKVVEPEGFGMISMISEHFVRFNSAGEQIGEWLKQPPSNTTGVPFRKRSTNGAGPSPPSFWGMFALVIFLNGLVEREILTGKHGFPHEI